MYNPYNIVKVFEQEIAKFTGAPYAVAISSCSNALFLCCKYCKVNNYPEIKVPKYTYPSVPASIINAGGRVKFIDIDWQKEMKYVLEPTTIIDSAKRLCRNDYIKSKLICLSFHAQKNIPIGRGGMILTDSLKAYKWFKLARFDGRHECLLETDVLTMTGYNMYLLPEQAARGLEHFNWVSKNEKNFCSRDKYQDLSKYNFYTRANR